MVVARVKMAAALVLAGLPLACGTAQNAHPPGPASPAAAAPSGPLAVIDAGAAPTLNIACGDGCYRYARDKTRGLTKLTLAHMRYPQDASPKVLVELRGGADSGLWETSEREAKDPLEIETSSAETYFEIYLSMETTRGRFTGMVNQRCPP